MTKHPSTPDGWAIKLTKVLNEIRKMQGIASYPLDAKEIAFEFSKIYFPESPIRDIKEILGVSDTVDGALFPINNGPNWAILYNPCIPSKGRINFTIAHEFGHFLLHRLLSPTQGFQCSSEKIENWNFQKNIEKEANQFASSLLMPFDDFREQIGNSSISLSLIDFLSDRYQVSRTAIMLRWLQGCSKRAKVVYSIDGYIDWIYPTKELAQSTPYVNPKNETVPVPEQSLQLRESDTFSCSHPVGVWSEEEEVKEIAFVYEKNSLKIGVSLLIYPDEAPERTEEQYGLYTSPQFRIFDD